MFKFLTIFFVSFVAFGCQEQPKDALLYSDVNLQVDRSQDVFLYLKSGEPYTGKQTYRFTKTDSVFLELTFKNGFKIYEAAYNEGGTIIGHSAYEYENGQMIRETVFFPNGNKMMERYNPIDTGGGYTKYWHVNGQLKFNITLDSANQNHGFMTLWDEEGNILEQEKYVHGAKIEV